MSTKFKAVISLMFALLILATPSFANNWGRHTKKLPPVYDKTGTASQWLAHYDSTATTTVNGETYSVGCNFSDTSVDCSDSFGGYEAKLEDGSTLEVGSEAAVFDDAGYSTLIYSPLAKEVADNISKCGQANSCRDKSITFKYRLLTIKNDPVSYLCVPFTTEDKHGKPVVSEACYVMPSATLNKP